MFSAYNRFVLTFILLHYCCMSDVVHLKVLVAVHRIVLFGVPLDDERVIKENRDRAKMHLGVLKLGVHRFLAMGTKRYGTAEQDL